MSCPWCQNGKCRTIEADCDFKTLKKDPESLKKRIDSEFENVKVRFEIIKRANKEEQINEQMTIVFDKLSGIKVMRDVLQTEFHEMYFPGNNPMEFTKLVIDARINAMKKTRGKKK